MSDYAKAQEEIAALKAENEKLKAELAATVKQAMPARFTEADDDDHPAKKKHK